MIQVRVGCWQLRLEPLFRPLAFVRRELDFLPSDAEFLLRVDLPSALQDMFSESGASWYCAGSVDSGGSGRRSDEAGGALGGGP